MLCSCHTFGGPAIPETTKPPTPHRDRGLPCVTGRPAWSTGATDAVPERAHGGRSSTTPTTETTSSTSADTTATSTRTRWSRAGGCSWLTTGTPSPLPPPSLTPHPSRSRPPPSTTRPPHPRSKGTTPPRARPASPGRPGPHASPPRASHGHAHPSTARHAARRGQQPRCTRADAASRARAHRSPAPRRRHGSPAGHTGHGTAGTATAGTGQRGARTTATHHERQRRWQREYVSTVLASDTGSADAATLTSERETSSEDDDSSEATMLSTTLSAEPGNAG